MKLDKHTISGIIGGNRRFISPFDETEPYTILDGENPLNEDFDIEIVNRYYERLRYAVMHADSLIRDAFDDRFYDAYFVNKEIVHSAAQMCSELIFDSFVMFRDHQTIGACLSNRYFMPGYFIDVTWDRNWKAISVWSC